MRFLLVLLLNVTLATQAIIGQSRQFINRPLIKKTLEKEIFPEISFINSLAIDADGWLWIAGRTIKKEGYKNQNQNPVFVRFNGLISQEIVLPRAFHSHSLNFKIDPLYQNTFLLSLQFEEELVLYFFETNTHKFTEIKLADGIPTDFPVTDAFHVDDKDLILISSKSSSKLYEIKSDGQFKELYDIPLLNSSQVNRLLAYEDFYLFVNEKNPMIMVNKSTGDAKEINKSDIVGGLDEIFKVQTIFTQDGRHNFQFSFDPGLYFLDEKTHEWRINKQFNDEFYSNISYDQHGNSLLQKITNDGIEISIKRNGSQEIMGEFELPGSAYYKTASHDFTKSIYLAERTKLFHIVFASNEVMTFLHDNSMRSILPLSEEEYLVATEADGYFRINVAEGSTRPYLLTQDNKPYTAFANRNFFDDGNSIWSNDYYGIIRIDKQNQSVKSFPYFRPSCMTQDEQLIYAGTVKYQLYAFNKSTLDFTMLDNTDTLDFSDVKVLDSTIYGATNKGLYIYKDGEGKLLTNLPNEDDLYLLSIDIDPELGVLIGTRSGKVLSYDPVSHAIKVLYTDALEASVADVVSDADGYLWVNSFAGIVKHNLETKEELRFDQLEGFTHHEANRNSFFQTDGGYRFIGTLKGLNYFHPDSLKPFENSARLELTALQYYDQYNNDLHRVKDKETLAHTEKVKLPASNRNLYLQFSVFGNQMLQEVNYRYSLNEDQWNSLGDRNEINLINLSPGDYQLKIDALSIDQKRIGEPITIDITSKEIFYKTSWFVFLIFSLVSGVSVWLLLESRKRRILQQDFSQKIIDTTEHQKASIARELHDSVGQKLVLLSRNANYANDLESESLIKTTLEELRNISKGLHPSILKNVGLSAAINSLIHEVDESSELFLTADIESIDQVVDDTTALHIYRIIQEALSNIIKHADAKAANVKVSKAPQSIEIEISDNGKGFSYNSKTTNGLGMRTLAERAAIIGSKIGIYSKHQNGTRILLSIPLTD